MKQTLGNWTHLASGSWSGYALSTTANQTSKIASPATIHKCLATLEQTDFLNFEVDPEDARRRIVSPTSKALKTLNTLSKQVDKWALKNS